MRQLIALEKHLIANVATLSAYPEKLQIWADKGTIVAGTLQTDYNHSYTYTANILVTDYAEEITTLTIPLIDFLKRHADDDEALRIGVEAEIIDHTRRDVLFTVALTDKILTRTTPDGVVILPPCTPSGTQWFTEQTT